MSTDVQPRRHQGDLAEVVEMLLDKGIVINADIAVSIGDTQLLGVQVRAAIASFETAAKYGLEFPEGTDMRRVAAAAGDPELAEMDRPRPPIDPTRSVNVTPEDTAATSDEDSSGDGESDTTDSSENDSEAESAESDDDGSDRFSEIDIDTAQSARGTEHFSARPDPDQPTSGGFDLLSDDSDDDRDTDPDGDHNAPTDETDDAEPDGMEATDT